MESVLLDVAGHRRSPATMPGSLRSASRIAPVMTRGGPPWSRRSTAGGVGGADDYERGIRGGRRRRHH